jgi:hypothetical protein
VTTLAAVLHNVFTGKIANGGAGFIMQFFEFLTHSLFIILFANGDAASVSTKRTWRGLNFGWIARHDSPECLLPT